MLKKFIIAFIISANILVISIFAEMYLSNMYQQNAYLDLTKIESFCISNPYCYADYKFANIKLFNCNKCQQYCTNNEYDISLNVNYNDAINCVLLELSNYTNSVYAYFNNCNYTYNIHTLLSTGMVANTLLDVLNGVVIVLITLSLSSTIAFIIVIIQFINV